MNSESLPRHQCTVGSLWLTLDREDFAKFLGGQFYGLRVRLPFKFLEEERAAGRLKISRP